MSEQEHDKMKKQLLDPKLTTKFHSLGFKKLTNIQNKAVPIIFQKKDSIIIAPTGSGKTECSIIPIFSKLYICSSNFVCPSSRQPAIRFFSLHGGVLYPGRI